MAAAATMALKLGYRRLACASTGNTSASMALYAAAASAPDRPMQAIVFVGSGKIAFGKLSQALDYGALTLQVDGDFDDGALARVDGVDFVRDGIDADYVVSTRGQAGSGNGPNISETENADSHSSLLAPPPVDWAARPRGKEWQMWRDEFQNAGFRSAAEGQSKCRSHRGHRDHRGGGFRFC